MKIKLIILTILFFINPAFSNQQDDAAREAKPDEIPFVYNPAIFTKVQIQKVRQNVAQPGDLSLPDEAPAHSCFFLEDKKEFPAFEKGPRYFYPAHSMVCVIPLEDKSVPDFAAAYPDVNKAAVKLRKLLKNRPRKFEPVKDFEDLPFNNASGVIEGKLQYFAFKSGKGVLFLTQYSQELHPNPINNEELTYNFQGLTNDGKYYVAARLSVTHPSLPKGIDFTDHIERDDKLRYLKRQEQMLNGFAEESFRPSLKTLKQLISSISIK